MLGQHLMLFCSKHDAARQVGFLDGPAGMFADLGCQNAVDVKFRADAQQQCIHAHGVGMGQFGDVADAQHHFDIGMVFPDFMIADDGLREAEMQRV